MDIVADSWIDSGRGVPEDVKGSGEVPDMSMGEGDKGAREQLPLITEL